MSPPSSEPDSVRNSGGANSSDLMSSSSSSWKERIVPPIAPRNGGNSGKARALGASPLPVLRVREERDVLAAPSSRAFVSWSASRKRLFRREEMLWRVPSRERG